MTDFPEGCVIVPFPDYSHSLAFDALFHPLCVVCVTFHIGVIEINVCKYYALPIAHCPFLRLIFIHRHYKTIINTLKSISIRLA